MLAFVPLMRLSAPRLSGGAWHRLFCSAGDPETAGGDGDELIYFFSARLWLTLPLGRGQQKPATAH